MRVLALLLLACGIFACADGSGPSAELRVDAVPPRLILSNEGSSPVYIMVVERNSLAVVDWVPCVNPLTCPGIRPGRDSIMLYSRITGYEAGEDEAIVYWWHLLPKAGGGFEVDEIRQVPVEL